METLYGELSVLKEQLQSEEFDSFCALIIHLNADEVFLFFKHLIEWFDTAIFSFIQYLYVVEFLEELPYQKVRLPKRISTLP